MLMGRGYLLKDELLLSKWVVPFIQSVRAFGVRQTTPSSDTWPWERSNVFSYVKMSYITNDRKT